MQSIVSDNQCTLTKDASESVKPVCVTDGTAVREASVCDRQDGSP